MSFTEGLAASVQRPRPCAGDGGGRPLGLAAWRARAVAAAADVPGGDGGSARRSASSGVALPWVEIGIAGSVLVLGAVVALALRPSLAVSVPLIGAVRAAARLQPRRRAAGERVGADLWRGLRRGDARAARDRHCHGPDRGPPAGPFRRAHRRRRDRRAGRGAAGYAVAAARAISPAVALPGKISDLITTGTAPELSSIVPMSM